MLLEEFDKSKNAIINPNMIVDKIENFPEITISCFSKKLFDNVLSFFEPKLICNLHSATGLQPVYEVEYKGGRLAFFQSYAGDNLDHSSWQPRSLSGNVRLDDKSKIVLLAFELGLKIIKFKNS